MGNKTMTWLKGILCIPQSKTGEWIKGSTTTVLHFECYFYCVPGNVPGGLLWLSRRECQKPLMPNLRGLCQTMKMLLKKCNIFVIVETVRQDRNAKYIFIKGLRHPHCEL